VRGLKYYHVVSVHLSAGRTPRGVRGLKLDADCPKICVENVAPLAGCVD